MEIKPKNSLDLGLRKAVRDGDLQSAKQFISAGADPMEADSLSLRTAARKGDAQMLEFLVERSQPSARKFEALKAAVIGGSEECLAILLPYANPVDVAQCGAISQAISLDRQRMLEMLIFMADPECLMNSRFILRAICEKRHECSKILCRAMYDAGGRAPFLAAERLFMREGREEHISILRSMLDIIVLNKDTPQPASTSQQRSLRI